MRDISEKMDSEGEVLRSESGSGHSFVNGNPPTLPTETSSVIRKTPGVLGGDARIRDTRIAVWMLVRARQLGMTDEEIRDRYRPPLDKADLEATWQYYNANKSEIDLAITENEAD